MIFSHMKISVYLQANIVVEKNNGNSKVMGARQSSE